jgi:hypothetical protein
MMADIRDTLEALPFFDFGHDPTRIDNDTFTVATDLTATYAVGRRVKLVGATTGYATIASSSYSAPDTTINVTMDSGNVPTSLLTVSLGPDSNAALSQSAIGSILYPRTAAEIAAGVTPTNYAYPPGDVRRYGAVGDGTTNSTTALIAAAASVGVGGSVTFEPSGVYMIDADTASGVHFSGKTKFVVEGNNATLKVISGEAVTGGFGMMYFTNCQDFTVRNLILDANRDGRTPAEAGAYNVVVQNSCARGLFDNVRAINAVIDGWTVTTSVPATLSTYPTDITLRNCSADNCYRNGLSVIGSLRLTIDGGSYSSTNGISPEDGIDVEPDTGYTHGNKDLVIRNARVYNNEGKGITVTGPDASPNINVTIENVQCDANDNAHIHIAQAQNAVVRGGRFGDLVGNASFGAIHLGDPSSTCRDVTVTGAVFYAITSSTPPACLYVSGDVEGRVSVKDIIATSIDCRAVLSGTANVSIDGVEILDCSGSLPAIQVDGARSALRNIKTDSTEAAAIYVTGSDCEIDGATIVDYGANAAAGIQFEAGATGSVVRNVSIHQRTSIPVGTYGIRYNGVVPRVIQNVSGKSAGTDFTVANLLGFISGVSGARISDCSPSIAEQSGSATIASGATTAVVTHGLGLTPVPSDIYITFTEQGTSDYGRWWVSGCTSTQFTLNVSADPGASNLDFAWRARVLS